jgi:hypothetical protein
MPPFHHRSHSHPTDAIKRYDTRTAGAVGTLARCEHGDVSIVEPRSGSCTYPSLPVHLTPSTTCRNQPCTLHSLIHTLTSSRMVDSTNTTPNSTHTVPCTRSHAATVERSMYLEVTSTSTPTHGLSRVREVMSWKISQTHPSPHPRHTADKASTKGRRTSRISLVVPYWL